MKYLLKFDRKMKGVKEKWWEMRRLRWSLWKHEKRTHRVRFVYKISWKEKRAKINFSDKYEEDANYTRWQTQKKISHRKCKSTWYFSKICKIECTDKNKTIARNDSISSTIVLPRWLYDTVFFVICNFILDRFLNFFLHFSRVMDR